MTAEEQAAADAKAKADKAAEDKKVQDEKDANDPAKLREQLAASKKAAEDFKTDMLKFKAQLGEFDTERAKLKLEADKKADEALKAEGKWKELYERAEERAAGLETSKKNQAAAFVKSLKFSEVSRAAMGAGLLQAASGDLEMVDLSPVSAVQAESGAISFNGVTDFVAELKKNKPHWFSGTTAPNLNTTQPGGVRLGSGDLTAEKILELEAKDPVAYREAIKSLMGQK